ncbi:MAG: hypothetical protein A2W00_04505 [Candidatus Eisenbacteria bacterium RBG_16_71_46]|nr:MAG: hypothetical protein A2W00_04505 [Candidatus Eisenbacteria bacterium RBG_16_71_46]
MYSTVVIVTGSGAEQRVAQWAEGRRRWEIQYDDRSRAQADVLAAFFIARQGRLRGFRFKDWADYSSKIGDVETKHATAQITTTTFQLQKVYTSGAITHTREINKPVAGTVQLYHPGTGVEVLPSYTVTLGAQASGHFHLTFNSQTTGEIAYNASAATVQTALTGLSSVGSGNATVTGSAGGPYTITFVGDLRNTTLALTADFSALETPGNASLSAVAWSLASATGVCTFAAAPGYVPTATFEFDVPVRFDTDQMQMKQDAVTVRSWSVPIVELRV